MTGGPRRLRTDQAILLCALGAGLPAVVVALVLLWRLPLEPWVRRGTIALLIASWLGLSAAARSAFVRPIQTLANLLAAIRIGDYSVRGHESRPDDPLGLATMEANALADRLKADRLGGVEAGALFRAVLAEIEVAILAFDAQDRLQFLNRAAETLLGRGPAQALGRSAEELGIADLLRVQAPITIERVFPGSAGRWDLRRGSFRREGLPHQLVVLADVSRALRQEEREAWKRLVRVLSHEINNSLAPIQSIAGSLVDLLRQEEPPEDVTEDLRQGLSVIASRSAALGRFMTSYARLARLPPPRAREIEIGAWLERVVRLESPEAVRLVGGPPLRVAGDPDQLEQVLINLLRNAREAAADGDPVEVGWEDRGATVEIWVRDRGPGISRTENLFVPFFTTKPGGTGIGLVLSRQIAEAHAGTLELENREDGPGAVAWLRLPAPAGGSRGAE